MQPLPCIIGLDADELADIKQRYGGPMVCHELLPQMMVRDNQLFVQSTSGARLLPISRMVFHGIFADDHDFITGLAIWAGECLPNAAAMMDCRLKLPCLARALRFTSFADPPRGYSSPGLEYIASGPSVAKWGNWHCGENKERFDDSMVTENASIVEPFILGEAIRVVVIGDSAWQIRLEGDDWLKSIHHDTASLIDLDSALVDDTRAVARGFGLEIAANDYIVDTNGVPHLLEVNHIPNVTRFPEIWEGYSTLVLDWLTADCG